MSQEAKRLNIALLTALDAKDRNSWSGTFYHILQSLQKHCGDVTCIGPLSAFREMLFGRVRHKAAQTLLGKRFAFRHTYAVAKKYAQVAEKRLHQQRFDVIIALSGATEIAFLETDTPVVLVEDANFAILRGYHQHFSALLESSAQQIQYIQERGIRRADLIVYPTLWAAQSAIEHYNADEGKIRVIPFGANLEMVPTKESILRREKAACCTLLFVGVDWKRKGGDIAFETLVALEKRGIPAELIICGCTPPREVAHPRMSVIPFLDKNDERERTMLEALYRKADFLLLPTRNECFGIAFCEANAFGLPVITTCTGGVPEVVRDGENGFTLPYYARGDAYAAVIADVYQDIPLYNQLILTSRLAFEERLNWDNWGKNMKKELTDMFFSQEPDSPLPLQIPC